MSNIKMSDGTLSDSVSLTVTTAEDLYPLSNLQIMQSSVKWRSTGVSTDNDIQGRFDQVRLIGCVGLFGHNFSTSGTVRKRLYTESIDRTIASAVYSSSEITITTEGSHGFTAGNKGTKGAYITNVLGMTEINDLNHDIKSVTSDTVYVIAWTSGTPTVFNYDGQAVSTSLDVVYDSTDDAIAPRYGWGESPWGLDGWYGYPTSEDSKSQTVKWFDGTESQYFKITISDPTNTDGYVEAGRLIVGQQWTPADNFSYGMGFGSVDESDLFRTRGGSLRSNNRPSFKTMSFSFDWLTYADAMSLNDLLKTVLLKRDLVVSAYPDGVTAAMDYETTMLGRLSGFTPITREAHGYLSSLEIQEAL